MGLDIYFGIERSNGDYESILILRNTHVVKNFVESRFGIRVYQTRMITLKMLIEIKDVIKADYLEKIEIYKKSDYKDHHNQQEFNAKEIMKNYLIETEEAIKVAKQRAFGERILYSSDF